MRKLLIIISILGFLVFPVSAAEYTAPQAPPEAEDLMPPESDSFGTDLWYIITKAFQTVYPEFAQTARTCLCVFAAAMLISILGSMAETRNKAVEFAGVLGISLLLLQNTGSMIDLASDTVSELSEYGKLLLPVMTAALAAQGGVSTSAALYAGTAVFDALLCNGIAKLLVPLVYIFLALATAACTTGDPMLQKLRDFIKWLVTWSLKTVLYIFTGYMSITGVVSGTADAAALKATKLTMSGMIPVVGGILSDASEAVIAGALVMKNSVGIYGMLAAAAIWIVPFFRIGIRYLLLKLTAALCGIFDIKVLNDLIGAFSTAMGILLGMTGAVCVMLMISAVCFMKGVG